MQYQTRKGQDMQLCQGSHQPLIVTNQASEG